MSRLEKKCLVASVGVHGTLFLLLFAAPLIWVSKHQELVLPVMTLIPTRLVDGATGGGGSPDVKNLVLPPAVQQSQPQLAVAPPISRPQPPSPKPEMKPAPSEPDVLPKPKSKAAEPVPTEKKPKKPKPEETDDAEDVTIGKRKIHLELKHEKVSEKAGSDARAQAQASAQAARAELSSRISQIVGAINRNASSGTTIEIPGPGGAAYADYGQFVQLVYKKAWAFPPDLADDSATVEATVVILRNGSIESFRVTRHSGHAALDHSVSRLENVRTVPPFPEGAQDERRTFVIEFNLRSMKTL